MRRPHARALPAILIASLTALLTLAPAFPAAAQQDLVEPLSREIDYHYNDYIQLDVQFPADLDIALLQLVFQYGPVSNARIFDLEVDDRNAARFTYDSSGARAIPAYEPVSYYYVLNLADGQQRETPRYAFAYLDNRFDWEQLDQDPRFVIHWYEGDADFAQAILNTAQNSIAASDHILPLPEPERVHIFVYADAVALREALDPTGVAEVAGHADPANGAILVAIQPGVEQNLEIERQIPHEINHVRLYAAYGTDYNRLPHWLREGLASLVELYPNPDFATALSVAHAERQLLDFTKLCAPFPPDSRQAFLAYAQSQSIVQYIYNQYGTTGLRDVLESYAAGASCANGTEAATGLTLTTLARDWQTAYFGTAAPPPATSSAGETSASPWLLIGALMLLWPLLFVLLRRVRS